MSNKDVLVSIQDTCDPGTFIGIDELYPDQQWRMVITELRSKGFQVVPHDKERIQDLTKKLAIAENQYKECLTLLKQVFEIQQETTRMGEKARHKLLTKVRNFLIKLYGS